MRPTRPIRLIPAVLLACSLFAQPCVTALADELPEEALPAQEEVLAMTDDSNEELVETEIENTSELVVEAGAEVEDAVGLAVEAEDEAASNLVAETKDDGDVVTSEVEIGGVQGDQSLSEDGSEVILSESDSDNETELSGETSVPVVTKQGWNQSEGGAWYWSDDGKTATSGWRRVGSAWYYFDPESFAMKAAEAFEAAGRTYVARDNGVCPASSWVELAAGWYLTDASCAARSGWAKSGSSWYYLDPETHVMRSGEVFADGGKAYVAKDSGVCPANEWVMLDGKWYRTKGDCALATGWAKISGSWYFLDRKTYVMKQSETFADGGKDYAAKSNGVCPVSSWVKLGDKWYRTNSSCALASGWAKSGSSWYYLDPETHAMKAGEVFEAGGKSYVAKASGVCPAGSWVKLGADWFRTDSSCALLTGWTQSSSRWYYLSPAADEGGPRGRMLTGFVEVGGKLYHLADPSGVMTASKWLELEDGTVGFAGYSGAITVVPDATMEGGRVSFTGDPGWNELGEDDHFYVNEDGSLATGWMKDGETWYYLDPSSYVAVRGTIVTVDGTPYVFAKSGAWIDITGDSALNKRIATILRDKTGLDLRACYEYVWRNFGYRGMGYWPSYANWQADYARQMLNNGSGNCYAYAALFQFMAKACDADTKLIKGWAIGMVSGKRTPHGWVEYYENGQTYVIDPEISYEAGTNVFFKFKYADCYKLPGIYYAYGNAGDTNLTILK